MMAIRQSEQIGYSNLVEAGWACRSTRARASPTGRAPPADRPADRICDRRRHPSGENLPQDAQRLIKTGRGEWLDAEMEKLADPANYQPIPERVAEDPAARRNPRCWAA
jgi:ribonuclease D